MSSLVWVIGSKGAFDWLRLNPIAAMGSTRDAIWYAFHASW